MKYFNNIKSADDLRKVYRAMCLTMHPDRGGNEEEFKAMQAEFEALKKQYQDGMTGRADYAHQETAAERAAREEEERREREEWARWEAEEKARREQEKREEAERIRKAQEASRKAVAEWAARLERVAVDKAGEKARYYRFEDKKAAAAFVATTKRNIKAVINHYFPGLKVTVNISGGTWKEKFIISWQDGPSVETLRDTCKELRYFIPSYYEPAGPCDDYGCYHEAKGSEPWREAYGQALGDIDDYEATRGLSDEGKQEAEEAAAAIFANWGQDSDQGRGTFTATLSEWVKFAELLGAKRDQWGHIDFYKSGMSWGNYANHQRTENGHDVGDIYFSSARKILRERFSVTRQPKEKAPEFVPKYGQTYKAIKKALGGNVFYVDQRNGRKNVENELSIFEAAERLAKGEAVSIGHRSEFDGEAVIYGTDNGGYKVQQKRSAKFEAVGVILKGKGYGSIYATIQAEGIKSETLEALRREAQDVERQRKEWEREQASKASGEADKGAKASKASDSKQGSKKADSEAEGVDLTAAPAEGLRLVETAEGVAVVADDWKTTYFNKKYIKAHGAHWNKERKQWEATEPQDVDALRAWFFFHGKPTDQGATIDEVKAESETANDSTEAQHIQSAEVITNDFGTIRVGERVTDGVHVGKFLCYAAKGPNDPGVLVIIADDLQVYEADPLKVRRADSEATESRQDSGTANEPQSDEKSDSGTRIRFSPEDVPDFEEAA